MQQSIDLNSNTMLELAGIVILGILAQWVAWRFKIPAILPLILIGLFVGPVAAEYLSEDGSKWIEPIWNGTNGLFPGDSLFYFVSLAISIILFEGGLTLRLNEVKNVGPVITKLITLGSIVTFFGAAIAVYYIFNLSWEISFLFSALIIVTGPTVITPILRNIPLKKDVSAVLKWEGILIDPIGALVAVLVFEFISVGGGGAFTKTAFIEFGKILLFGTTFGFTFAHGLNFALKRKLIPHYLLNVFALAVVLGVFVLSDAFAHESGLLSVVVMGMVLGNTNSPHLKELLYFKESLSVLLISILFILLAANINMQDLLLIFNWETVGLFAVVVFIIRPLGVFLSTMNSTLRFNEKLFISWVGPRGIVAAGIASLFGLKLAKSHVPGAEYITPLVFMVVLGTVLLNASTARLFAKVTGVFLKKSEGILIIGASEVARLIAQYLDNQGRQVILIDTNPSNIEKASKLGLNALNADIYSEALTDDIELSEVGFLFALTASADINNYAINKFKNQFGEQGTFKVLSRDETSSETPSVDGTNGLLCSHNDFMSFSEIARKFPTIHEVKIKNQEDFNLHLEIAKEDGNSIPLFLKHASGELDIIALNGDSRTQNFGKNTALVYLGKLIETS